MLEFISCMEYMFTISNDYDKESQFLLEKTVEILHKINMFDSI